MSEQNNYTIKAEQELKRAEFQSSIKNYDAHMDKARLYATLALVEQQRIANLISLAGKTFDHNEAMDALITIPEGGDVSRFPLKSEIRTALGLD